MADQAPLIETAEARAPPGGEAAWYAGAGGAKLRAAMFTPQGRGRARGSIVLSGGRTECIEKYYEFIGECLDRGFVVLAHDWRGQGLSRRDLADPLRGHAKGFKPYLEDFRLLLDAYAERLPKPWVAMGHSMGGCLTLLAMAQGEDRFAGAIFSAPMLGIRTPFPMVVSRALTGLNIAAGRGSAYTLGGPGKPYDNAFEGNVLTHDPVRHARAWSLVAAEPKLALGAPTWGWIDFTLRATAYLARPDTLRGVTVPVVIVSAEEDQLIDPAAQAAAARHLPQGKLITVPGAYHEILMETDPMRNIFLRAFDALTGRVAPTPADPPKPAAAAAPAPAAAAAAAPKPTLSAPAATSTAAKPAANKPAGKRKPAMKKPAAKTAAKPAAAKKTAAKKPAAKKAPAKAAAKKPAVKKAPAKAKPAAAKKAPAARKPAAKKPAAKKPAAKPAASKAPSVAKKAAKKPAAKKPAAKKAPAKK
jgi:lysophospholipase